MNILKKLRKNINIVFIGNSLEDFNASVETNIDFILKLNSENILSRKKINVRTIQSFKYLNRYI